MNAPCQCREPWDYCPHEGQSAPSTAQHRRAGGTGLWESDKKPACLPFSLSVFVFFLETWSFYIGLAVLELSM